MAVGAKRAVGTRQVPGNPAQTALLLTNLSLVTVITTQKWGFLILVTQFKLLNSNHEKPATLQELLPKCCWHSNRTWTLFKDLREGDQDHPYMEPCVHLHPQYYGHDSSTYRAGMRRWSQVDAGLQFGILILPLQDHHKQLTKRAGAGGPIFQTPLK